MMQLQLDMFRTDEEEELIQLRKYVEEVKLSNDKVRKKLFADRGNDRKLLFEVEERLKIIEKFICKT